QHRDGGVGLLRFAQNIESRRTGHLQIRNHQQIPARAHLLNRGRAIRSFVHSVSRALQGLAHHGAQFALVFNEQERFHLFRFYHESGCSQRTTEHACAEKGSTASHSMARSKLLRVFESKIAALWKMEISQYKKT